MTMDIASQTAILNDARATVAAKVAAAAALWDLIEKCEGALEPFKREMRNAAVAQAVGAALPASVVTDGDGLTQCKVVIPAPSLKLNKGVTVEGERAALGELFNTVYEVELRLRKPDPRFLATFPANVQAHVATVTTLVENTPRVSLKTLPGVTDVTRT